MINKIVLISVLCFILGYYGFSNVVQTSNEIEMLIHQIESNNEQFQKAYSMTVELRRVLSVILIFFLLRVIGIVIRVIVYIKRIKLPHWLDMLL